MIGPMDPRAEAALTRAENIVDAWTKVARDLDGLSPWSERELERLIAAALLEQAGLAPESARQAVRQ